MWLLHTFIFPCSHYICYKKYMIHVMQSEWVADFVSCWRYLFSVIICTMIWLGLVIFYTLSTAQSLFICLGIKFSPTLREFLDYPLNSPPSLTHTHADLKDHIYAHSTPDCMTQILILELHTHTQRIWERGDHIYAHSGNFLSVHTPLHYTNIDIVAHLLFHLLPALIEVQQ